MNKTDLTKKKMEVYKSYHIPNLQNYMRRTKNAVFIHAGSWEHELEKFKICFELKKEGKEFITEAQENSSKLIRDIVVLDTGEIIECETDEQRAKRFDSQKNVRVVMVKLK